FTDVWAEAHGAQITQQYRCSILAADRNRGEIVKRTQITEAADHVLCAALIKHAPAHFIRTHLYFVNHGRKRYAVREQLVGIELHLILPDEAADAGDLGNSRHGFKGIAQVPVLQTAQVGKTAFSALID